MIDPARVRELTAEAEAHTARLQAIHAELAALAANDRQDPPAAPPAAPPPPSNVIPGPWAPKPGKGLQNGAAFLASLTEDADLFGGRVSRDALAGCLRLCDAGAGVLPVGWMAYLLATSYHETGYRMAPVPEAGGAGYLAKYDTGRLAAILGNTPERDGDGIKWAGRGDVQLTGWTNYKRADAKLAALGLIKAGDLLANPDLALRPDLSAVIAVWGMREGWFTGKTFNHYIGSRKTPLGTLAEFTDARRIINGTDKAAKIAAHAIAFQDALVAGGWL